jgi:hypothetical protein
MCGALLLLVGNKQEEQREQSYLPEFIVGNIFLTRENLFSINQIHGEHYYPQ